MRRKKQKKDSGRGVAPDPIKMKYFEMEFDGLGDLTFEERLGVLREMGKEAEEKFSDQYNELQDWFKTYDQLNLLSFSYYYFMTTRRGYDEEAATGTLEFPPYYQELMQAFALTLPRTYNAVPFLSRDIKRFKVNFKEVGELMRLKHFNLPDSVTTMEEVQSHQLRTQVIMQTTAVRNWSYEDKMKATTLGLANSIKESFSEVHHFDPEVFLQTLYDMFDIIQERVNVHRNKTIQILKATTHEDVFKTYEDIFPVKRDNEESKKIMWDAFGHDLMRLKEFFMMHSDLFLYELFTFTYVELEKISDRKINEATFKDAFRKISLEFGDLKDYDYQHFILSNPTHECPFIRTDEDTVFSTLWSVMTHFSMGLLEKFCGYDQRLRKKYNDARAKFLENSLENLCRNAFPTAEIHAGSKWRGVNGKLYENDLLVIIDSFAIVIEAKSGQVSAPAKRGAKDRLFKTLQELIEEPSEQALRFIEYLKANPKNLSLEVEKGPNNKFDAGKIKHYIPLGVTFSHLGMVGTNLKHLIGAGVTKKELKELASSISLTDLEVVFDLLPLQMEKVHYLQRRRELEASIDFIGDEHDLLAWYLETGFNFEKTEKKYIYNMTLKSKELDNYIIGKAHGEKVRKPVLQMTKWWRDMLEYMEHRQFTTWAQSSYILLNFNQGRQKHFEKEVLKLKKEMVSKRTEHVHKWIGLESSDEQRNFIVIGYNYHDDVKDERRGIVGDILEEQENVDSKGKLVIGLNVDKAHYPYSALGSTLSAALFDRNYSGMNRDSQEENGSVQK